MAIYSTAQGNPTLYYSSQFIAFGYCTYDNDGNLYLEGYTNIYGQIGIARVSKGSNSIEQIQLNTAIYGGRFFIPTIQWDGQNITISSLRSGVASSRLVYIYRLAISGTNAHVIGTTKLHSRKHVGIAAQTWIYGNAIIGSESGPNYGKVSFWRYPKGGQPTYTIQKATDLRKALPWGVTISPSASR